MSSTETLLARSPLPALTSALHRAHVSVIAYHGVPDTGAFARQLGALRRWGTIISPDQLRAGFAGETLPRRPILLTFDDGERSVLDNGAPVLADTGLQALLFVVAGLVGSSTPFWWDEVAELAPDGPAEVQYLKTRDDTERRSRISELRASAPPVRRSQLEPSDLASLSGIGVEIGNHTFDHPCLDKCAHAPAIQQIEDAHATLLRLGIEATAFAYPNGNLDARVEPTLRELGYDLGFVFDHRHARLDRSPLRVSRLRLDAAASPDRAQLIVSGAHGALMRLRRRG